MEFDVETFDPRFWGIHAEWPKLMWDATGEASLFGLQESDSPGMPTRNPQLYTPGLRLARKPPAGKWDLDAESVAQFDALYGARRFEHGPTGIYGKFARANSQSPGLRLTTRPCKLLELMADYRGDSIYGYISADFVV